MTSGTIFLIRVPFSSLFFNVLQIDNAEFTCPSYFSLGAKALIRRILDPNPETVSFLVVHGLPFHLKVKILTNVALLSLLFAANYNC